MGQHQVYINYANHKLAGLIQNFYDDNETSTPMEIGEIEQKIKQEWYLLDSMVDLFEKIEEGVEFVEAVNIPIPRGGVVNIAYLLNLRTG